MANVGYSRSLWLLICGFREGLGKETSLHTRGDFDSSGQRLGTYATLFESVHRIPYHQEASTGMRFDLCVYVLCLDPIRHICSHLAFEVASNAIQASIVRHALLCTHALNVMFGGLLGHVERGKKNAHSI